MPGALELAIRHHRKGELSQAEALYKAILRKHPQAPDPLHLLGCIELRRGNRERAVRLMEEAVRLAPQTPLYRENLAEAYHRSGRPDLARAECQLALRFDPRRPAALNRLGVLAMEANAYEEAKSRFSEALDVQPVYPEALINLGAVLTRMGDFDLARDSCELALRAEPANALAWNNLGLAHKGAGRRDEARGAFERAGDFPSAQFNLAYLDLLDDDLDRGLRGFEVRRKLAPLAHRPPGPEWDGRPRPAQHLLVVHEQGLGDTILMSRFFQPLLEKFRAVSLLVQPPLERLLAGLDPRLEVRSAPDGLRADLWCRALSLPYLLGIRSRDALPVAPWLPRARTSPAGGPLRAGINWAGNPSFHYDRTRSTTLDTLRPLLELPGVTWVSLHRGHREEEARTRGLPEPLRDAKDFYDTAAVLGDLDLVVSTETAIPNLSAAMGVPTLLLAAVDHDWRWRSWYEDVVVCAQDVPGDWSGAVAAARRAIEAQVRDRSRLDPRPVSR